MMPYTNINGIDIYYEMHGQGEPLLLLSGAGGDLTYWQPISIKLSQHNKVILFDFRDAGRSEQSDHPYHIDILAQETKQFLDTLSIKKVHVLGHSMGGMVAQQLAYQFPELINKLILYSTTTKMRTIGKLALTSMSELKQQEKNFELLVKTFSMWSYSNDYLSQESMMENIIQAAKNQLYPQTAQGYEKQIKATCDFDSTPWIATIKANTLILAGADDLLTPLSDATFIKNAITNSQLKIIKNVAHCGHLEKTKLFVKTLIEFLHPQL
ncbi:MAG TPA: hypothetical protein DIC51_03455 [Coxiellaceae bacterium]|nr:hypothetical protein [Coxiellaceae bacterium]